ncbi:MAG: O-antigen ligase family protein [bacterium]|nr:O-antigen ligase family protein [bacterium]
MSDTEKVFSWILKGGLLATPFIVFIVTRSLYFPFITGKNFTFRILIELIAVVWVYAAFRFPRFRPRASAIAVAVTIFMAAMGIATVLSISPYRSFWSSFERMEGYIGLLHLFLYFLILGTMFRTPRDWSVFFHTSLAASVLVSFYALFQLAGVFSIHQGGTRVDATFGNATYLATYLLFHLFFLIWFFLRTSQSWARAAYGVAFLLELTILYYTATRGAILGLIGGLVILGVLLAILERGTLRRIALAGLGALILVPALFFLVKDTAFVRQNAVLDRFASISPSETTTRARFTIWQMAFRGWQERPVTGWGQESFTYVFSKYYEPSLWSQEPWFDRAHNVFLDWLIAGGVLALGAYLAIFAVAGWFLVRGWKSGVFDTASLAVLSSLLAAHFFQILFVFDNLTSYLLFFAVIAYLHAVTRPSPGARPKPAPPIMASVAAAAAFVVVLPLLYLGNIRPIRAAHAILQSLQTNQAHPPAGKVDALISVFEGGIGLHTFGTTELREQASQVSSAVSRDAGLAPQDKKKFIEFTVRELEAQVKEFPYDMRAKAFSATLLNMAGRPADSVKAVAEALALNDRRQQFYFVAAEAYLDGGAPDQAIALLRKAYDLAPAYSEAAINLASVLILAGREAEAEAFLLERFGSRIVGDEHYANAYAQRRNFAKSLLVWQELVRRNPENPQYYAELGVALARVGRTEDAVRAVEEAVRREPRFQANGDQLIKAIRAGQLTPK